MIFNHKDCFYLRHGRFEDYLSETLPYIVFYSQVFRFYHSIIDWNIRLLFSV